jgi:hypothetical protein
MDQPTYANLEDLLELRGLVETLTKQLAEQQETLLKIAQSHLTIMGLVGRQVTVLELMEKK